MDHREIARHILALLAARAATASICPSEVARSVAPTSWRPLMARVRAVAAEMAERGALRITQGAEEIAPDRVRSGGVKGPLRLRRAGA